MTRGAVTTAELDRAARRMRQWLDQRRGATSDPLVVERMRPTRTGWAAIYRLGFGEPRAVAVEARDGRVRSISPEDAALL